MCDPEAFSAIGEWLALTHIYGEESWNHLQWWVSGSFAIILTSHFARDSLNAFVASLLGLLYVLFSILVGLNLRQNSVQIGGAFQDVTDFASAHGCGELVTITVENVGWGMDQAIAVSLVLMSVFLVLMFFSTLGYLAYAWRLNVKTKGR